MNIRLCTLEISTQNYVSNAHFYEWEKMFNSVNPFWYRDHNFIVLPLLSFFHQLWVTVTHSVKWCLIIKSTLFRGRIFRSETNYICWKLTILASVLNHSDVINTSCARHTIYTQTCFVYSDGWFIVRLTDRLWLDQR